MATVVLAAAVVLTPRLDNVDFAGLRAALVTPVPQPSNTAQLTVEGLTALADLEQS